MAIVHIWKRQQAQIWTTRRPPLSVFGSTNLLGTTKRWRNRSPRKLRVRTRTRSCNRRSATSPNGNSWSAHYQRQTFFRQDTAAHHMEFNKFQQQGLELYEMLSTTISLSSKMLAKTQPTYLVAVQNNCPHILFTMLAASHQCSSATRSLNSLTVLLSIRQNGLSHPMLVDHVNTAFDQAILCWQSPTQPGYIAVED